MIGDESFVKIVNGGFGVTLHSVCVIEVTAVSRIKAFFSFKVLLYIKGQFGYIL